MRALIRLAWAKFKDWPTRGDNYRRMPGPSCRYPIKRSTKDPRHAQDWNLARAWPELPFYSGPSPKVSGVCCSSTAYAALWVAAMQVW